MLRAALSGAVLVIATSNTYSTDPPLARFGKLPADAEVHLVGVSLPLRSGVSYSEVTDWRGLVKALRVKDGVGAHVRKLLPKDADEVLTDELEAGQLDDRPPAFVKEFATRKLAALLSKTVRSKVIYDKDVFANVELTDSLKDLVGRGDKRTVYQTERMNRELLSLLYPKFLAETPGDYHTIHVTVKPGRPVVLVTSASIQTRWVVRVEEGATVAGVIQYGSGAQELTGTDAPVVYRSAIRPDGTKGPTNGLGAYKQNEEDVVYKRLKGDVRELTGKDFASFQGKYQSAAEPFVVRPSAK